MKVVVATAAFTLGVTLSLAKAVAPDRQIGRLEVRTLVQMFEYFHFRHELVTEKDFARLTETFLDGLDPEHAYLLQPDANQLTARYGGNLVNRLRAMGDLAPATIVHDLYKTRVKERAAWIARRMQNWSPTPTDDLSAPPPSSTWAAQPESLDQYWEHRLRNEWARDVVAGSDPQQAAERLRRHYEMLAVQVAARTDDEVAILMLNSFTAIYDTRSVYYDAKTIATAAEAGTTKQVGIGANLKSTGDNYVFENVISGGPAARSGKIQPGDRLVAVESPDRERIDVTGLELRDVVRLTAGPDGTEVTVVVEHPDSLGRETVRLTRSRVSSERVRIFLCSGPGFTGRQAPLGVVVLPVLYGTTPDDSNPGAAEDVRLGLAQLDKEGAEGLVLDLRGNTGGLLSEATAVAGLFLGSEAAVRVKDSTGKVKADQTKPARKVYPKPVVVLVDGVTASGAEIIAGALQDFGRAVIVGSGNTAGAGMIQAVLQMQNYMPRSPSPPASGAVKMTVQKFYLPDGTSPEQRGIAPDVVLPAMPFKSALTLPRQAAEAVPDVLPSQVGPADPARPERLAALKARSERRQGELPEFLFLRKWAEEYGRYAEKPSGNLEQLREGIHAREAAKGRFELEAGEVGKHTPSPRKIEQLRDPAGGPGSGKHDSAKQGLSGDSLEKQPFDPMLHEALRILADDIKLSTRPAAAGLPGIKPR